jgi:hypothetical protein
MEALGAGPDLASVRVNFSTALSIAVALTAGRLTHEELAPAWLAEHEAEVRELACRVNLHHDWDLTLQTVRAPLEAGVSLDDVPWNAWPKVRRRMKDLHMDDLQLGWSDLRELLSRREVRAYLGSEISGGLRPRVLSRDRVRAPSIPATAGSRATHGRGVSTLDTGRPLMSFPCNVTIKLKSGRTVELEGREAGGSGHAVEEQRAVVEEKCRLTGVEEAAWTAA